MSDKDDRRERLIDTMEHAMIRFDEVLPELRTLLGDDHPDLIAAIEAADEVKDHLASLGRSARLQ